MSFIVKNTTLPSLLDLLAPHSCRGCDTLGAPLCKHCKNYITNQKFNLCPNCKNPTKHGNCPRCKTLPPTYAIGERNELLDILVHEYKYNSNRALAKPLAEMLCDILPPLPKNTILVPLPTTASHIRARGFDHTYLIAKHLAKIHHIKLQKLLLRNNNTTQVGSDRQTRLLQAKTAYSVNLSIPINPSATYILFDDVWTTGASMKAAVKKLRQAGAKHVIIALLAVSRLN